MKKLLLFAMALCLMLGACNRSQSNVARYVPEKNFMDQMDTIPVRLYTLHNNYLSAQVTNYGARVVSLYTPDRNGNPDNILVGHDNLKDYVIARGERYLGAVAGPVTGRISGGSFTMDGVTYQTEKNDGDNTFNGGSLGVDKRPWKVLIQNDSTLNMQVVLPDGDGGFPGKRVIQVTYALTGNSFMVLIRAFADARTPLSLAWQPWFNLHGEGEGTVEDHRLAISALSFLPVNMDGNPTGDVTPVRNTPFDYLSMHTLGEGLKDLKGDFNNTWCLVMENNFPMHEACAMIDPVSGRKVTVLTNRPGLQVSTAGAFDGVIPGTNGKPIAKHGAVLLSAQDWPDAVNQPLFPTVFVDPAGYFASTAIYRFETID